MLCKKCPHLVRHGRVDSDGEIIFVNNCGLLMKAEILEAGGDVFKKPGRKPSKNKERPLKKPPVKLPEGDFECKSLPFPENFNYFDCGVYQATFKGANNKSGVVPTRDFQYLSSLSPSSITDMELL